MESEVPSEEEVPRSELDAAFDVCRDWGWVVVPIVSSTPWGYVVWVGGRTNEFHMAATLELP